MNGTPERLQKAVLLLALLAPIVVLPLSRGGYAQSQTAMPACEWCGAAEAPEDVGWSTTIAQPNEPGDPLIISGTVYHPEGSTPASGAVLYIYHTNAKGIYPKRGTETGNGQRHGYLRSWVRTNDRGRYRFETIRPGRYPTRTEPAHIHMTVKAPEAGEYWIEDLVFEGDPLITPKNRHWVHVVRLTRDANGIWRGMRNVVLNR